MTELVNPATKSNELKLHRRVSAENLSALEKFEQNTKCNKYFDSDLDQLESGCDTSALEFNSLAALGFVKNKCSDGVDLAHFVNKIKIMSIDNDIFADESTEDKLLDEEDVPSHLVEEFDSRALVSALAVGV